MQNRWEFHPFECKYSVCPALFSQETIPSLFSIYGSLFKYLLNVYEWVYLWDLDPVPLVHMSTFVPVPWCFDYCTFVRPSALLFLKIALDIWNLFVAHMNFTFLKQYNAVISQYSLASELVKPYTCHILTRKKCFHTQCFLGTHHTC